MCWSLFLIKLHVFRPVQVCCEYCKILRTPILKNICERLLLKVNFKVNLNPLCNFELLQSFDPFNLKCLFVSGTPQDFSKINK